MLSRGVSGPVGFFLIESWRFLKNALSLARSKSGSSIDVLRLAGSRGQFFSHARTIHTGHSGSCPSLAGVLQLSNEKDMRKIDPNFGELTRCVC